MTLMAKSLFIFFSLLFLNKQINEDKWSLIEIDSTISNNIIFKKLDKKTEIFDRTEKNDVSIKRTSDVTYFDTRYKSLRKEKYSKNNNCRAYYFRSDTLMINIGLGMGFSGRGFIIRYKNKNFYTKPYTWNDIGAEGDSDLEHYPIYKIVYQKVILNKQHYNVGDSLFGKVDFKSIEINWDSSKIEHFGKGYFRTKVGNR